MDGVARAARRLLLACGLVGPLVLGACSGESEGAAGPSAGAGEATEVARPDRAAGDAAAASGHADPGRAAGVASEPPVHAPAAEVVVAAPRRAVEVNGERIPDGRLAQLDRQYGIGILGGAYGYDAARGATGLVGGPTLGFVLPGLALGGRFGRRRGRLGQRLERLVPSAPRRD